MTLNSENAYAIIDNQNVILLGAQRSVHVRFANLLVVVSSIGRSRVDKYM